MTVTLRPVNQSNYEDLCDLDVNQKQQAYVACNMWSLVEAAYHDNYICRGIYHDEIPVGFTMWVIESAKKTSIWRMMIDQRFQNRGIGTQALGKIIDEIKQSQTIEHIEICYDPNNACAKSFYARFGFKEVGLDEDGDDMLAAIHI